MCLSVLTIPYTGTCGVVIGKAIGAGAWKKNKLKVKENQRNVWLQKHNFPIVNHLQTE